MTPLSAHGRTLWNGEQGIAQNDDVRSVFDPNEKRRTNVTIGSVILPDAMNNATNPGRVGMVVDINHDRETGEAIYTVLRTRQVRDHFEAWTFSLPASEVRPENVVPDGSRARHDYGLSALRAAADGRWMTAEGYRIAGIGLALVRDCLAGHEVSKT